MNQFSVAGVIREVLPRTSDRAPWQIIVETAVSKDRTADAVLEIFRLEEPPVGAFIVASGHLGCREWNNKKYLKLFCTTAEIIRTEQAADGRPANLPF